MSPMRPVALLAEGVDRNGLMQINVCNHRVALLAEGVDRNLFGCRNQTETSVALLAEGVDRNKNLKLSVNEALGRPPRGGRG